MKVSISFVSVLLLICSLLGCVPSEENVREDLPNIVFLFSDDQSSPDLGAYGNSAIQTPNLDRLAEEGMVFRRGYVTSSQCSPSRASILTGRSPHVVGASRLHIDAQPRYESLIETLNDQGYYTGAFRKVHQSEIQEQFDFYGDGAASFSSFFESLPEDQPFFLWFGTTDPHRGYNVDEYEYQHNPENVIVPEYLPDTEEVRKDLANYYNEITRFDTESGEILNLLEERGLSENTMVVVSSDNGMPFPRAKATLYEAGVRVPLIIKWPSHVESGSTDELVSLVDLPATWLDAAGSEIPEGFGGKSLLPFFEDSESDHREYIFAERNWHDNWDPMRAVIGDRYKLIQNYRPEVEYIPSLDILNSPSYAEIQRLDSEGKLSGNLSWYQQDSRPQVEFYDLQNDPNEWNNLAGNAEYDSLINEYQQILSEWMNETNDFLPAPKGSFPAGSNLNDMYDPLNAEEY